MPHLIGKKPMKWTTTITTIKQKITNWKHWHPQILHTKNFAQPSGWRAPTATGFWFFFLVFVSVLTPVMWVKKVCSYSISIIYTHYFSNNMHACIAYRMCVYKLALVWTFKLFRQWHTRDSSCLCLPFTWLDHYYLFYQIFFPSKIKEKKTHTHTHFSRLY